MSDSIVASPIQLVLVLVLVLVSVNTHSELAAVSYTLPYASAWEKAIHRRGFTTILIVIYTQ